MPLVFSAAAATDVGRKRKANEDAYRLLPHENTWILADGMGGHVAGQVASNMAVEKIADFMERWRHEPDFVWPFEPDPRLSDEANCIQMAVRVANVRIFNRGQSDDACQNMGTTVVALTWSEQAGLIIAHVGDSRCYRLRQGKLQQLTEDHSLVNHLKRVFNLTDEQARARASSNVIVRAVGLEDDVDVDITLVKPEPGDVYLSCSDGLSDLLKDEQIQSVMNINLPNLDQTAQALVNAANQAGGTDNITAVLVAALNASDPS